MTGPEAEAAGAAEYARVTGSRVIPRRPADDDDPDGYLESDNDWIANNQEAVLEWMTSQCGDECTGTPPSPAPVVLSPGQRKLLVEALRLVVARAECHMIPRTTGEASSKLAALLEGAESVVVTKGGA